VLQESDNRPKQSEGHLLERVKTKLMLKGIVVLRKLSKGRFYDVIYAYGEKPNWDIGDPQPEMARLADSGEIKGDVLEVGCGTGENGLYLSRLGHEVWGIDFASSAIEKAVAKARERGLKANFVVGDVSNLQSLGRTFDSVIDVGLFHSLDNRQRQLFLDSLRLALRPGGIYHLLCISDREPVPGNHVSQEEIRDAFSAGAWNINYIRQARLRTVNEKDGKLAWLSSITRL
jgi:2-polyprenyl-3-methyl-5-hydroxy-6-metoxy-1,4-benzoquinol methylase